ncbi:peptidyl-prolyl cis-trans isomerase [candidate division WOR-3 bacterium]|nr:peptidyl-prolyl cis-trans isomerase [candidate division WOR-3 bacterium]
MKYSLLILIIVALVSCTQQPKDVIVKVDGSTLTKAEFNMYVTEENYRQLPEERIKEFCETWADQEVLYLEAKRQEIHKEDSISMVLSEYEKNLLAMELVRREFGDATVADEEIRQYFEKHKEEFLYAVKVAQIVLPSFESAQMTLDEIKAGADFYRLAKERSLTRLENPENPMVVTELLQRGMIGDFAIEEKVFSMEQGELSDVIPYVQGTFLIVKIVEKKKIKANVELTRELRGQIYNYLITKRYQDFLTQYVDSLKAQYTITIDLSPLKPPVE